MIRHYNEETREYEVLFPVLEDIDNARVFGATIMDGHLVLEEGCDTWFSHKLNRSQVLALAEEFRRIADMMPEQ